MWGLALSMVLSLLPGRYRSRLPAMSVDLRFGTIVTGLLQLLVCLTVYIVRYLSFFRQRVGSMGEAAISRAGDAALGVPAVQYGMGFVTMVEYIFHPLSLLLVYFAVEGGVRLLAAVAAEENVGTLPLYIVAWVEEGLGKARAERALGPRVPDRVEFIPGVDYQLRVASCRPKRNWDRLITVSYEGELYAVVGESPAEPPHRYVYQLRLIRPGWTVRGIHYYDPMEVMQAAQAKTPSWFTRWAREKIAGAHAEAPPWVPDRLEWISSQKHQLRVHSCRPKPTWDHLITVEYEGNLYEVAGTIEGQPPHPYVYLLRNLPARQDHPRRPSLPSRRAAGRGISGSSWMLSATLQSFVVSPHLPSP